eukprot:scaffold360_cov374-Pavlova_lutheri.AAC.16
MQWWKRTYGGILEMWARCDAPPGSPVSNQGHESSNKTFKKVHMPTKDNQRRLHPHKALGLLRNETSFLVREKVRAFSFNNDSGAIVTPRMRHKVHPFVASGCWVMRQHIGHKF